MKKKQKFHQNYVDVSVIFVDVEIVPLVLNINEIFLLFVNTSMNVLALKTSNINETVIAVFHGFE